MNGHGGVEVGGNKKEIQIEETDSTSTVNYSVRMVVDYDSDMMANFSDLRFLDSTETVELPYWVDSYTESVSALVWVAVDLTADSNSTIYMYYGNINRCCYNR